MVLQQGMHAVARTSLHSVRRGRREVKGSALACAFLFLPGDASLSASAARAPCEAARPLEASLLLPGGSQQPHAWNLASQKILLTKLLGGRHDKAAVSDARGEG